MILPEVYQGGGWFPSFSRFMEAFDPKWYRTYGCAPYTPEEVREAAVEFAPDIPALPEEYLDFLTHMGGRGLDLAFHLHQPPYRPCPEAEEYCRTHPVEALSEEELWDIGFQIQVKKLSGPLEQLGYERAWFSTELDHIWLKEDACCINSREFDPNDMFDTAAVSLWGMGKETVWALAEQFKRLGYGNALEMRDGST